MKHTLMLLILLLSKTVVAQTALPDFLQGTWIAEGQELYEHWDKLNDHSMKGFSYRIADGLMTISEYLDMNRTENGIVYTAYLLNQNMGEGIVFNLTNADNAFIFENPDHDFPKLISYQKLSDSEIMIEVSDGKQKIFKYRMKKLFAVEHK